MNFGIAALLAFASLLFVVPVSRKGRIGRTSAVGIFVTILGLCLWAVPAARLYFPVWRPLTAPLPLSEGATLREEFLVRTSERYDIDLVCQGVGLFEEEWKDALNSKSPPTLECDLDVRILRRGEVQEWTVLKSLSPSWTSRPSVGWAIADVHLSPGKYEFVIANRKDLSRLRPTSPTVQMRISIVDLKDRGFDHLIGFLAGGPVFLIGLLTLLLSRLWNRHARASDVRRISSADSGS